MKFGVSDTGSIYCPVVIKVDHIIVLNYTSILLNCIRSLLSFGNIQTSCDSNLFHPGQKRQRHLNRF